MRRVDDKVMFEIYREESHGRRYRVVYFTELGNHDKEREIGRAFDGEHVFDGFLDGGRLGDAKTAIGSMLDRWNAGAAPADEEVSEAIGEFLVP